MAITVSRGLEWEKCFQFGRNTIVKIDSRNDPEVLVAEMHFLNFAAGSHEVEMKELNVQTENSVEKQGKYLEGYCHYNDQGVIILNVTVQ